MWLYIVLIVDGYVPHVQLATPDKDRALSFAKKWAEEWNNESMGSAGEIYFNQKEDGSIEYAVSVQETEVEEVIA